MPPLAWPLVAPWRRWQSCRRLPPQQQRRNRGLACQRRRWMAPEASPALRTASRALQDAGEALTAAEAAFKVEDDRAVEWQKQNPPPQGDKRAMSRWLRLARKVRESSDMQSAWDTQIAAEEAFQAAQMEVAKVEPQDLSELVLKACLALVFEEEGQEGLKMAWSRNNSHVIGRSVAINLAVMSVRVQS
jgi:hypothetical protein